MPLRFNLHEYPLLFLVGYMGSGKSTVGKQLARQLGWKFIDLDHQIELKYNQSVSEIFQSKGEIFYREAEREALKDLSTKKDIVVATGGGCPVFHDNMDRMKRMGLTVFLKVHPGTLFHRIAPEKQIRPLISSMPDVDIMEYIIETLKQRLPYYIAAHLTVNGDAEPDVVVGSITRAISIQP